MVERVGRLKGGEGTERKECESVGGGGGGRVWETMKVRMFGALLQGEDFLVDVRAMNSH